MQQHFSKAANSPDSDTYSLIRQAVGGIDIPREAPNTPLPQLGPAVRQAIAAVENADVKNDLFLKAFKEQMLNHLKHVSFDFKIDDETYPHDLVLADAFPAAPTRKALQKTLDFLDVFYATKNSAPEIRHTISRSEEEICEAHSAVIKTIIADPFAYYQNARERFEKDGSAASFSEFKDVVDFLLYKIENDPEASSVIAANPHMRALAAVTHEALIQASPAYAYQKTLDAIERGLEFFDIVARGLHPEMSAPLYHSGRYEYYSHYLTAQVPEHIFFPTMHNLTIIDLLNVRGAPIGFAGVFTDIQRVDGFPQTPYEFYMHDVNHSRRMQQFASECARKLGMNEVEFHEKSDAYVRNTLLPQIIIQETDDTATRTKKNIKKMILFEILHEDALAAESGVVRDAILRPPMLLTAFEKIEGNTVTYIMEPGATTLAYVYRKLAHTFYDRPEKRAETIVDTPSRNRAAIAEAAKELYADLGLGEVPVDKIDAYTWTDEGFPDDFKRTLEDDIEKRGLEKLGSKPVKKPAVTSRRSSVTPR
jgi:hypothetical protein